MPSYQSILAFNGGEISPYLARRLDFEKYPTGCERLENFLPMPFGGIQKRPGTLHRATLSASTRLEPFTFNAANRYILAFSADALDIYAPDGTLKDTIAATFADPFALQFENINDVVFIADPSAPPRRLSRVADTNWTLEDIPFDYPPLLDQNTDQEHTLTVEPLAAAVNWLDATAYIVGNVRQNGGAYYICHTSHTSDPTTEPDVGADWFTVWRRYTIEPGESAAITASAATWTADHVGSTWRFDLERALPLFETSVNIKSASTLYSPPIPIPARWQVVTTGVWDGTVTLQRSTDGATWTDYRAWSGEKDRNVDEEDAFDSRYLARIKWVGASATTSTPQPRAILYALDSVLSGLFTITGYTSATAVTAEAVSTLDLGSSWKWTPGAFDDVNGYPSAIAVHERRLCFAGTTANPVSLWLSKSDDLLDFQTGTTADDSIFVTLATTAQDPIRWLASQRRLMIGTSIAEWVCGSETNDQPTTPENFNARQYTHYGSAALPAWRHNEGVFFVQRQGRRFREIGYDITRETYDAADLTRLSEHITAGGIVQVDFQTGREPYVWAVRGDGTILAFHYSRQERLAAWSKHSTAGGLFTSVAVLRNDLEADDVFVVVNRGGTYHLEQFASDQQSVQEAGDADDPIHLDAAVTGTTNGSGILAGLSHLEGETITFLADGISGTATVASGQINTGRASVTATAGLPITSTFTSLPLDSGTQNGTSLGRAKRASRILADFFKTRGASWTYNGQTYPVTFDETADLGDSTPALATGWKETILGNGGYVRDLQITLTHSDPWPITLRAASIVWDVSEP